MRCGPCEQDRARTPEKSCVPVLLQNAISFELNDGWWISSVLIGIDYPRCRMARSAQSFCEKTLQPRPRPSEFETLAE